jgi:hypothetical protein
MFSRDKFHLRKEKRVPIGRRRKHFPLKKGLRHRLSRSSTSPSSSSSSLSSSSSSSKKTSNNKVKSGSRKKRKYYHCKKTSSSDGPKLFSSSYAMDVIKWDKKEQDLIDIININGLGYMANTGAKTVSRYLYY